MNPSTPQHTNNGVPTSVVSSTPTSGSSSRSYVSSAMTQATNNNVNANFMPTMQNSNINPTQPSNFSGKRVIRKITPIDPKKLQQAGLDRKIAEALSKQKSQMVFNKLSNSAERPSPSSKTSSPATPTSVIKTTQTISRPSSSSSTVIHSTPPPASISVVSGKKLTPTKNIIPPKITITGPEAPTETDKEHLNNLSPQQRLNHVKNILNKKLLLKKNINVTNDNKGFIHLKPPSSGHGKFPLLNATPLPQTLITPLVPTSTGRLHDSRIFELPTRQGLLPTVKEINTSSFPTPTGYTQLIDTEQTTPKTKLSTKSKTPKKSPQDIARKLNFQTEEQRVEQEVPKVLQFIKKNPMKFLNHDETPVSNISHSKQLSKSENDIPKASIRSSTVQYHHHPPNYNYKQFNYGRQNIDFPEVSPLKTPFPTVNVPQETPLPTIDTFKKPYPMPVSTYYHVQENVEHFHNVPTPMEYMTASYESLPLPEPTPVPMPVPVSAPIPHPPPSSQLPTRANDNFNISTPSTLKSTRHSMPSPNCLIVLENKVLSQDEMIDLTALRLSTSKVNTPQRFARPHKPIPEVVIKQEKPDDFPTTSSDMLKKVPKQQQQKSETLIKQQGDNQDPSAEMIALPAKQNKKIIVNAHKLKLPQEKIAELAKKIAQSTSSSSSQTSNKSIKVETQTQIKSNTNSNTEMRVLNPKVAYKRNIVTIDKMPPLESFQRRYIVNEDVSQTTNQHVTSELLNDQRCDTPIQGAKIKNEQIDTPNIIYQTEENSIQIPREQATITTIVKQEPDAVYHISPPPREPTSNISGNLQRSPVIKTLPSHGLQKVIIKDEPTTAMLNFSSSFTVNRKSAVEIIDEPPENEDTFSAVDFLAAFANNDAMTEETTLELSPEELNLNASCAMNLSPLRISSNASRKRTISLTASQKQVTIPSLLNSTVPNDSMTTNIGNIVSIQDNQLVEIDSKNVSFTMDNSNSLSTIVIQSSNGPETIVTPENKCPIVRMPSNKLKSVKIFNALDSTKLGLPKLKDMEKTPKDLMEIPPTVTSDMMKKINFVMESTQKDSKDLKEILPKIPSNMKSDFETSFIDFCGRKKKSISEDGNKSDSPKEASVSKHYKARTNLSNIKMSKQLNNLETSKDGLNVSSCIIMQNQSEKLNKIPSTKDYEKIQNFDNFKSNDLIVKPTEKSVIINAKILHDNSGEVTNIKEIVPKTTNNDDNIIETETQTKTMVKSPENSVSFSPIDTHEQNRNIIMSDQMIEKSIKSPVKTMERPTLKSPEKGTEIVKPSLPLDMDRQIDIESVKSKDFAPTSTMSDLKTTLETDVQKNFPIKTSLKSPIKPTQKTVNLKSILKFSAPIEIQQTSHIESSEMMVTINEQLNLTTKSQDITITHNLNESPQSSQNSEESKTSAPTKRISRFKKGKINLVQRNKPGGGAVVKKPTTDSGEVEGLDKKNVNISINKEHEPVVEPIEQTSNENNHQNKVIDIPPCQSTVEEIKIAENSNNLETNKNSSVIDIPESCSRIEEIKIADKSNDNKDSSEMDIDISYIEYTSERSTNVNTISTLSNSIANEVSKEESFTVPKGTETDKTAIVDIPTQSIEPYDENNSSGVVETPIKDISQLIKPPKMPKRKSETIKSENLTADSVKILEEMKQAKVSLIDIVKHSPPQIAAVPPQIPFKRKCNETPHNLTEPMGIKTLLKFKKSMENKNNQEVDQENQKENQEIEESTPTCSTPTTTKCNSNEQRQLSEFSLEEPSDKETKRKPGRPSVKKSNKSLIDIKNDDDDKSTKSSEKRKHMSESEVSTPIMSRRSSRFSLSSKPETPTPPSSSKSTTKTRHSSLRQQISDDDLEFLPVNAEIKEFNIAKQRISSKDRRNKMEKESLTEKSSVIKEAIETRQESSRESSIEKANYIKRTNLSAKTVEIENRIQVISANPEIPSNSKNKESVVTTTFTPQTKRTRYSSRPAESENTNRDDSLRICTKTNESDISNQEKQQDSKSTSTPLTKRSRHSSRHSETEDANRDKTPKISNKITEAALTSSSTPLTRRSRHSSRPSETEDTNGDETSKISNKIAESNVLSSSTPLTKRTRHSSRLSETEDTNRDETSKISNKITESDLTPSSTPLTKRSRYSSRPSETEYTGRSETSKISNKITESDLTSSSTPRTKISQNYTHPSDSEDTNLIDYVKNKSLIEKVTTTELQDEHDNSKISSTKKSVVSSSYPSKSESPQRSDSLKIKSLPEKLAAVISRRTRFSSKPTDPEDSCQDSPHDLKLKNIKQRKKLRKTLEDIKKDSQKPYLDTDSDDDRDFDSVNGLEEGREFLGFEENSAGSGKPSQMSSHYDNHSDEENNFQIDSTVKQVGGTIKNWLTTGKAISPTFGKDPNAKRSRRQDQIKTNRTVPLKKRWDLKKNLQVETDITDDTSPADDEDEPSTTSMSRGGKRGLKNVIDSNKDLLVNKKIKLDTNMAITHTFLEPPRPLDTDSDCQEITSKLLSKRKKYCITEELVGAVGKGCENEKSSAANITEDSSKSKILVNEEKENSSCSKNYSLKENKLEEFQHEIKSKNKKLTDNKGTSEEFSTEEESCTTSKRKGVKTVLHTITTKDLVTPMHLDFSTEDESNKLQDVRSSKTEKTLGNIEDGSDISCPTNKDKDDENSLTKQDDFSKDQDSFIPSRTDFDAEEESHQVQDSKEHDIERDIPTSCQSEFSTEKESDELQDDVSSKNKISNRKEQKQIDDNKADDLLGNTAQSKSDTNMEIPSKLKPDELQDDVSSTNKIANKKEEKQIDDTKTDELLDNASSSISDKNNEIQSNESMGHKKHIKDKPAKESHKTPKSSSTPKLSRKSKKEKETAELEKPSTESREVHAKIDINSSLLNEEKPEYSQKTLEASSSSKYKKSKISKDNNNLQAAQVTPVESKVHKEQLKIDINSSLVNENSTEILEPSKHKKSKTSKEKKKLKQVQENTPVISKGSVLATQQEEISKIVLNSSLVNNEKTENSNKTLESSISSENKTSTDNQQQVQEDVSDYIVEIKEHPIITEHTGVILTPKLKSQIKRPLKIENSCDESTPKIPKKRGRKPKIKIIDPSDDDKLPETDITIAAHTLVSSSSLEHKTSTDNQQQVQEDISDSIVETPKLKSPIKRTLKIEDSCDEITPKIPKKRGRKPKVVKIIDPSDDENDDKLSETNMAIAAPNNDFNTTDDISTPPIRKRRSIKTNNLPIVNNFNPRLLLATNRQQLDTDEVLTVTNPGNGPVQCGLCLKHTTVAKWTVHLADHYGVGWQVGEEKLEIECRNVVLKHMLYYFKDTEIKGIICRMCNKLYRSAAGLLMHIETCGMPAVRVICEYCKKDYSKLSLPIHVRTCQERLKLEIEMTPEVVPEEPQEEVFGNTGRLKRHSTIKAENKLKVIGAELDKVANEQQKQLADAFVPRDHIKYLPPLDIDEVYQKWTQDLENFEKCFCPKKVCKFNSPVLKELEEHIKHCKFIKFGYFCRSCKQAPFDTEEEALAHVYKNHDPSYEKSDHSDCDIKTDFEYSSEECDLSDEVDEDESEDNDEGEDEDIVADGHEYGRKPRSRKIKGKGNRIKVYYNPNNVYRKRVYETRAIDINKEISDKWKSFLSSNYSSQTLFPDLISQYSIINNQDFAKYLPSQVSSMKFNFEKNTTLNTTIGGESDSNINCWQELKRFETLDMKNEVFFFLGASIKFCVWLPLPVDVNEQYLLVGYRKEMFKFIKFEQPKQHHTILMIFKVTQFNRNPQLELHYGFVINDGPVHSAQFLPSGGYSEALNRLGLVAVATVNSTIKVYSLPINVKIEECDKVEGVTIIEVNRNFELNLDAIDQGQTDHSITTTQCLEICWSEYSGHNIIFASFSNGFIGIWDITDDPQDNLNRFVVENVVNYCPLHFFYIGEKGSNKLAVHYDSEGPRWLALTAKYRKFLVYDIKNMSQPFLLKDEINKNIVRSIDWCPVLSTVLSAHGDAIPNNGRCIYSIIPTNVLYNQQRIDIMSTGVNQVHYTPFHNLLVSGVDNGDIVFSNPREFHYDYPMGKRYEDGRRIVSSMDVKQLDGKAIIKPPTKQKPHDELPTDWTIHEQDYKDKYGLIFNPPCKLNDSNKSIYLNEDRRPPANITPIMRINALRCNLNQKAKRLVTVGYENGFIRILYFNKETQFENV